FSCSSHSSFISSNLLIIFIRWACGVNSPEFNKNVPVLVVSKISRPFGDHSKVALVKSPSVILLGSLENPIGRFVVSITHKPEFKSVAFTFVPSDGGTIYAIFVKSFDGVGLM